MTERHSKADEPKIVVDPAERAKLEARNALEQFDAVINTVEQFTAAEHPPFRLRSSMILQLQRIALKGLSAYRLPSRRLPALGSLWLGKRQAQQARLAKCRGTSS
jgi:hypothetical protein